MQFLRHPAGSSDLCTLFDSRGTREIEKKGNKWLVTTLSLGLCCRRPAHLASLCLAAGPPPPAAGGLEGCQMTNLARQLGLSSCNKESFDHNPQYLMQFMGPMDGNLNRKGPTGLARTHDSHWILIRDIYLFRPIGSLNAHPRLNCSALTSYGR